MRTTGGMGLRYEKSLEGISYSRSQSQKMGMHSATSTKAVVGQIVSVYDEPPAHSETSTAKLHGP